MDSAYQISHLRGITCKNKPFLKVWGINMAAGRHLDFRKRHKGDS